MTEPADPTPPGAQLPPPDATGAPAQPRFRSGAVARMAGIPVSTLRIWERRYQVVAPPQTDSGHRLYAEHDVQRLALLKQLVGLGHAIGTVAPLALAALQALVATRAAEAQAEPAGERRDAPRSVLLVGRSLARRRADGLFASLAVAGECADLAAAESDTAGLAADLLLVQANTLHHDSAARVLVLAQRLGAARVVVLYGFAPERVLQSLRAGGATARRAPLPDHDLAALLSNLPAVRQQVFAAAPGAVAPRRFSDEALVEIAARANTVACECPRQVAELVAQLAGFEAYSAECLNRSAGDAALHADLHHVASTARALFESALERVAQAEGFALPTG